LRVFCVLLEFAEIIVAPLFQVGGDMIELVLRTGKDKGLIKDVVPGPRVWDKCLQENMKIWEERQQNGMLQLNTLAITL